MNKYLIASLAVVAASVTAFTLEYKFEDDSEVIQNAVESSIINPDNIKFVKVLEVDEKYDDMKPVQKMEFKSLKVRQVTEDEVAEFVNSNMQKIVKQKEEVTKPDYYDIQKVPIEEWEERVLYEKLSH